MKLNNLSRLTALLLALTMIVSSVAMAEGAVSQEDYTITDYATQLAEETGTCELCVTQTQFPTVAPDGSTITITCGYEYLASFADNAARYEYFQWLDQNLSTTAPAALKQAHSDHVANGDEALICVESDGCISAGVYTAPGPSHTEGTCPWWQATEYVPLTERTLEDETTGVTVTGKMPADVTLQVTPIALTDEQLSTFSIENEEILVMAYDISLVDADGNVWQPVEGQQMVVAFDGTLLGMSDGLLYQVRHQHGDVVTISDVATVTGGKLTYTTDSFSIFAVTGLWGVATDAYGTDSITLYVGDTIYVRENGNGNNWGVEDDSIVSISSAEGQTKPDGTELDYSYCQITALQAGTTTLYVYDNSPNRPSQSITITVLEKQIITDVAIEDKIYTTGCLVPSILGEDGNPVDTTGFTYKWYKNSNLSGTGDYTEVTGEALSATYVDAENAAGGVNVAVDQGGMCWYKVEAYDAVGTYVGMSDPYWVPYSNELENGSFEIPNITGYNPFTAWGAGNVQFNQDDSRYVTTATNVANGTALWWRTTGPSAGRDIEIVRPGNAKLNGVYYVNPAAGNQYAELNCEAIGTLYQDVLTAPGTTLTWSFSHLGRNGLDTMAVVVMPANIADEWAAQLTGQTSAAGINNILYQIDAIDGAQVWYDLEASEEDDNTSPEWTEHSGTYQTVEGQYLSRFFFVSVDSASNSQTEGNFIDGVSFDDKLNYTIRYYVDGELRSASTETGSVKPYTLVSATHTGDFSQYALDKIEKSANGSTNNWGSTSMKVDTNDVYLDIFYVSTGISITKKVVVEDPNGYLTADELTAAENEIWGNFGSAAFDLLDSSGTKVASATVSVNSETGEGVALFMVENTKFVPEHNETFTIVETSEHTVDGFTWLKMSAVEVQIPNNTLAASAEYTNTYTAQPKTGDLVISKTVSGTTETDTFEFTVTLTDENGAALSGEYTIEGANVFTIKNGEKFTLTVGSSAPASAKIVGLPIDTQYTVTETPKAGYTANAEGATGAIKSGDNTVTFTNTYSVGNLSITKTVIGNTAPEGAEFSFVVDFAPLDDIPLETSYNYVITKVSDSSQVSTGTITDDGTIELQNGQIVTISGIQAGVDYTVTEQNLDTTSYSLTTTGNTGKIPANGIAAATFTNTYTKGDLAITKTVSGPGGTFTFTVNLLNANNQPLAGEFDITGANVSKISHGGQFTLTVDANATGSVTIKDLPAGTVCTVTETAVAGYATTVDNKDDLSGTATIAQGTVVTVPFVNTYSVADLTIEKTVVFDDGVSIPDQDFTINVALEAADNAVLASTYSYTKTDVQGGTTNGELTVSDKALTFTLKHGEKIVIHDLQLNTKYTVTEAETTYYTGTVAPASQQTIGTGDNKVTVTNTYNTGNLTVTKKVEGTHAPKENGVYSDEFTFTLTLSDTTVKVNCKIGSAEPVVLMSGGTFELTHEQTATIYGIPDGVTYTVTEAQPEGFAYTTKVGDTITNVATGTANDNPTVTFTNTYKYSHLTITKTGTNIDENDTFIFTIDGTDDATAGIYMQVVIKGTGNVTVTHLPVGEYTVSENTSWSWRYTCTVPSQEVTLVATRGGAVTFTNNKTNNQWLDGSAYADNNFDGNLKD